MRNVAIAQKIPIKAHIVRMDDMTGGLTFEQLALGINFLNVMYQDANIEFFVCEMEEVANSDYFTFDQTEPDNDTEDELASLTTESINAVNVYFVDAITTGSGSSACGYARFPFDDSVSNRIVMRNSCTDGSPQGTFSHEFGHYFALAHTHSGTENGPDDDNAENVARVGANANCDTNGDLLCDTQADPSSYSDGIDFGTCMYIDDSTDINGEVYDPPINNIMSYWPDFCGGIFTPDQYNQIATGLADRLTHTEYSFDCTAEIVNLPTDLSATDKCGTVILNWTDEADNELGYLIERSSISANAGFAPIPYAALGPNEITFTEGTATIGTEYWYRIKAINGDPDTYSNVTSITPEQQYCQTITTDWFCGGDHVYIDTVRFGDIDNTSGCDIGGYACFTQLTTEISSPLNLDLSLGGFPPGLAHLVAVVYYVDWNEDGDFDDSNEQNPLPTVVDTVFWSTTVEVPISASPGSKRFRIRAYWQPDGDSTVCSNHPDNEAEDYTLVVVDPLSVDLLSFTAQSVQNDIDLNWKTTNEVNNAGFNILHTKHGFSSFNKIGFVPFQSTHEAIRNYKFSHQNPGPGRHLYLLEQVDNDGSIERSAIREVTVGETIESVTLHPNPASTKIILQGLASMEGGIATLHTTNGQRIISTRINSQNPEINISEIPEGVYFLSLLTESGHIQRKFVIAR